MAKEIEMLEFKEEIIENIKVKRRFDIISFYWGILYMNIGYFIVFTEDLYIITIIISTIMLFMAKIIQK